MESPRSWVRTPVVGVVVGLLAGGIVIMLVEAGGHALFGTAEPGDLSNVTVPMFLSVLVAWAAGSAIGGAVATWWSHRRPMWAGLVVGVLLLGGALLNMAAIPHPTWLLVAAVVLMPGFAYLAARRFATPGDVASP